MGLAAVELYVRSGQTDLHSGGYGAVVPNAAQITARIAAAMHDDQGRVAEPGFYEDVVELTPADRSEIALMAPADRTLLKEIGVISLTGEAGFTPEERRSA